MDLKEFSKANLARCINGFGHSLESWSPAEWTNAIGGELGEAQNLTKKLLRHRDNIAGNIKEIDKDPASLKRRAAEELGDAMAYIDLAIQALGEDTEEILRFIWNRKSEEIEYPVRLGETKKDNKEAQKLVSKLWDVRRDGKWLGQVTETNETFARLAALSKFHDEIGDDDFDVNECKL